MPQPGKAIISKHGKRHLQRQAIRLRLKRSEPYCIPENHAFDAWFKRACRIAPVTTPEENMKALPERGVPCFSAVALVFLLLMPEEGEIKALLEPLRAEIAKAEGRETA